MECTAEERSNCGTVLFMVFVGLSIGFAFVGLREWSGMPNK